MAAIRESSAASKEDIAKFVTAITLSVMLGAGISGLAYSTFGFLGCMLIGVVTFIPALFVYPYVFSDQKPNKARQLPWLDLQEAVSFLRQDQVILKIALGLGLFNLIGSMIPAVMGLAFQKSFGKGSIFFGLTIAAGLGIGISLNSIFARISDKIVIRNIVPWSLIPTLVFFLLCGFNPNLLFFVALYISACVGSSFRNVMTGIIRVKRIPSELVGRVNTVYMGILFLGQAIGGLLLVPQFQGNLQRGSFLGAAVVSAAILFSFVSLPKMQMAKIVGAN